MRPSTASIFHSFFWGGPKPVGDSVRRTRLHFDRLVYQSARVTFGQNEEDFRLGGVSDRLHARMGQSDNRIVAFL